MVRPANNRVRSSCIRSTATDTITVAHPPVKGTDTRPSWSLRVFRIRCAQINPLSVPRQHGLRRIFQHYPGSQFRSNIKNSGYYTSTLSAWYHKTNCTKSIRKKTKGSRCRPTEVSKTSAMLAAARTTEERHGIRTRRGGSIKQYTRAPRDSHHSNARLT